MTIRITPKMIVVFYNDYQTRTGNNTRVGPANVYYSRSDFEKSAAHYGWGALAPTDKVAHMGDQVSVFEVLHGALEPVRVRYL